MGNKIAVTYFKLVLFTSDVQDKDVNNIYKIFMLNIFAYIFFYNVLCLKALPNAEQYR